MAFLKIQVLDKQEEELIHSQSLKSLNEIGVLVRSEPVLNMLGESGAEIDSKTGIAKFSESMIKEALQRKPKRVKLCGRDPTKDLEIPVGNAPPYLTIDGTTIYIYDIDTGEKRSATRKDLTDLVNLADALDAVDFIWPLVTATDVPEASHTAHEMWTALKGCTKNFQGDVISRKDALTQIALAALVVGGREELKKRPIFSAVNCPIAPLSFERGAVEAQVELARTGIPIVAMSMSLSGMSSPVTFAGTIVNINTENLASLAITQFAESGAPHIYSSESAPIDMMTGNMNYGAPEMLPLAAAAGQMARRYNWPCMVGSWGFDGGAPGMNLSFSEAAGGAMRVLCNTDLAVGIGGLDDAKGCSLEQMVIDSHIWGNFKAFLREFSVSEDTVALDVVKEVGHGNSFLSHPHTAKNFRKELVFWDKKSLEWEATLSNKMVPEARAVAKKLLKEHEVIPIDPDIMKQGDAVIAEYEKELIA